MNKIGLGFDDFEIGQRFESYKITVTEAHIIIFAGLSGDFNPLHVDDTFARKSLFGSRIAHGILTLSLMSGYLGMLVASTALAFLEMKVKFLLPVKIGDTIHSIIEVIEKRPTEKYNGGVIVFKSQVYNQKNEIVMEGNFSLLIARRSD
jgi:3-hydroxybutyryl-CoA dehydratase